MGKLQSEISDVSTAKASCPEIFIEMGERNMVPFFNILQHGFCVRTRVGCSIRDMLGEQFEISSQYARERIKTLFLNGKPVDDMEKATIEDGDTLALSGAMPGLVGATFRSGGVLASFRSSISYRQELTQCEDKGEGVIFLKLFNLLVPEMGPAILKKGILITRSQMEDFLLMEFLRIQSRILRVMVDGKEMAAESLGAESLPEDAPWIGLRVENL